MARLLCLSRCNLGRSLRLLLSSKKLSILMWTRRGSDTVRHDLLCHSAGSSVHCRLVKMLLTGDDSPEVLHCHVPDAIRSVIGILRPKLDLQLPKLCTNIGRHLHP